MKIANNTILYFEKLVDTGTGTRTKQIFFRKSKGG
jgi:hypothetical protein